MLCVTLSLPKHLYRWWKLLSRIVSHRSFAGQKCSFRKRFSSLECVKSGNWSKRSYDVLQTCRNHFAKDIIWRHNGSEWVKPVRKVWPTHSEARFYEFSGLLKIVWKSRITDSPEPSLTFCKQTLLTTFKSGPIVVAKRVGSERCLFAIALRIERHYCWTHCRIVESPWNRYLSFSFSLFDKSMVVSSRWPVVTAT